jgi:class 3 adenylate cyclase
VFTWVAPLLPRPAAAATQGDITRIIPHRATGRADYFGPPVNRAARFLAASAPGQILAERTLVEQCVEAWSADGLVRRVGQRVRGTCALVRLAAYVAAAAQTGVQSAGRRMTPFH